MREPAAVPVMQKFAPYIHDRWKLTHIGIYGIVEAGQVVEKRLYGIPESFERFKADK